MLISPLSPETLQSAMRLYHHDSADGQAAFIGGSQNLVYAYAHGGRDYILRLTPCANRSESLVRSELDWIVYLASNEIPVSAPIPAINGGWTEVIRTAQGDYVCVSFEKAPGRQVHYPECLQDNSLYERLGRLTGKLHALARTYSPPKHAVRRHDWQRNWFLRHLDLLPASQTVVRESCLELFESIRALPTASQAYGIIHGDIGVGNFTVDERGTVTLFDFDEAQYSWFVEDIAIQLYYLVYVFGDADDGMALREEQAGRFMAHFMKGYRLEHDLDAYWLRRIPLFLRLRELIVYVGSFRDWDGDETFSGSGNPWLIDWIAESRCRIENRVPIVDIWTDRTDFMDK